MRAPAWIAVFAGALILASGCGSGSARLCGQCGPTLLAVGEDVVWVAQGRTLSRFDPDSGDLLTRVEVLRQRPGGDDVQAITLNGGDAWLGWSGAVAAVRPSGAIAFRQVRRPSGYAVGRSPWHPTGRFGSVDGCRPGPPTSWAVTAWCGWSAARRRARIPGEGWRIVPVGTGYAIALDAETGRRVRSLETGPGPLAIAAWGDSIWVASSAGLDQHDAVSGRRLNHLAFEGGMIAIGEGRLWALEHDGTLRRMDPRDGRQGGSTKSNQGVGSLAVGDGAVWVGGDTTGPGITRIEASSLRASWHRAIPFD